MGKFTNLEKDGPVIETHCKYLGGNQSSYQRLTLEQFLEQCRSILANIVQVQETGKGWREKIAQQALVLANNRNKASAWYCVDLEYIQQREDGSLPSFGRFDIVAVSKEPVAQNRRRVALIELKVGYGTYQSDIPADAAAQIDRGEFSISEYTGSLGSGIVGHLADFCRFEQAGQFEKLKEEICTILANKRALGFEVPVPELRPDELEEQPHFYFLTLCEPGAAPSCKKSMFNHLGSTGHGRMATYHAVNILGSDFLDRENYHFLFAPEEMCAKKELNILGEPGTEPLV